MGHDQWVFVIPKMLRPTFLHHWELIGGLALAAWETVLELMCAAVGDRGMRPGMVAVVQTAGDLANWHPHVHALVSRGGWTEAGKSGTTDPVGRTLKSRGPGAWLQLCSSRTKLRAWHPLPSRCRNQVLLPVSCDDPPARSTRRRNSFDELLWYSNVSRGKRRKAAVENGEAGGAAADSCSRAAREEIRDARALRRSWAQLIKRIFEVDPLVCPSCGTEMKVIAFITVHDVIDEILRHLERREGQKTRAPPS